MTRVDIGRMDRRFVIERVGRSADGGGGAVETWTGIGVAWAAVQTPGGAEALQADGLAGRLRHEVIIRWRGDVTPAMRLREGARILDIRAAFDPDGRRRWLKCICEERIA